MKRQKSGYKGVFFREHETRRHGKGPDRYYILRYRIDGQAKEEALGWASETGLNAKKASLILAKLKLAQVAGAHGRTLQERRQIVKEKKENEKAEKEEAEKNEITFAHVFQKYLTQCKADGKVSVVREKNLFQNWINKAIGRKALRDITPLDLERLKSLMRKGKGKTGKKQSPRSIQYALSTVRQTFNYARNIGVTVDNPVKKVRFPKFDNVRRRFLTKPEAKKLLDALEAEDPETYQMALISLHCGLRASEIFRLEWIDVSTEDKIIMIRDAKAGTRDARMTNQVRQVFLNKKVGQPHDLVFPGPNGQRREIPATFKRVVEECALNAGITDRRQRIVFHSLRHTFASWLLQAGENIYVIAKMLGQKTLSMAGRYTHVDDTQKQQAVKSLEEFINEEPDKGKDQETASNVVPLNE